MGKFDFRHVPEPAAKEVYTLGLTKFFRTEFEMKCDEDREIFIGNVLCRVGLKGSVELVQVHTKQGLVFVAYDGFQDGLCLAITSVPLLETMKSAKIIRSYSPLETPQLTFPDWHPGCGLGLQRN